MKYIYLAICFSILSFCSFAYADTKEIAPKDEIGKQANGIEANVYFTSGVTTNSISDLMAVLEQIRFNYPKVGKINLLINSPGGDVSAGMQAYWNLKSYPLPVHAINVGDVSSAATFLFCAAGERSSVPSGTFLLHPPATAINDYVKPDVIEREREYIRANVAFMESVYKECTNMNDDDIKDMLKAEYNSKFLDNKQAEKIALTNGTIDKIPQSAVSFFIQEKNSG